MSLRIAILGANGLIGQALALDLKRRGHEVRAFARHFTPAQRSLLGTSTTETPLLPLSEEQWLVLLDGCGLVVNTIGILQGGDVDDIHHHFAARLAKVCAAAPAKLLVHLSIPGQDADDRTAYSRSKRQGERAISGAGGPHVILRPGFVIGTPAYGGSALLRALAALPLALPARESNAPFAATAMADICETVGYLAARWEAGDKAWYKSWDVMEKKPGTVGSIIAAFRAHDGGPVPLFAIPWFLLMPGALAGDAAAWAGWKPPIRSTAIHEMRRGVKGDPGPWMADTGITPRSARQAIEATPSTVQEKWFARLYLLKALSLVTLVVFWGASGLIALTAAFQPARQILLDHGFAPPLATAITIASSLLDISVGLLIAVRRTAGLGLALGILVSLGYMAGAALFTPDMWIEPLGALVKTAPAIILMLVCLAMLDDR